MRYKKEGEIISIYRNKKSPIIQVKEGFKNEDGCLHCDLFDICLEEKLDNRSVSICQKLESLGIIEEKDLGDRFFIKYETDRYTFFN